MYTGSSGLRGVVKGFYIKNYPHDWPALIQKGSDTTRDYIAFTLAQWLYPTKAINKAGIVTF